MKTKIIILTVIVIALGVIFWSRSKTESPVSNTDNDDIISTSTGNTNQDQSISDGVITIPYNSKEFGLATNKTQILANSYIPPCDENFNYCLYYIGKDFEGTNFETAGIRIQKRTDLMNERLCIDTPPEGFDATKKPDKTKSKDPYSSSVFSNIGDAGAGHSAVGSLYRLFIRENSACYELQTRVGQTQYANYPEGTIKEFTADAAQAMQVELKQILSNISLLSGEKVLFP